MEVRLYRGNLGYLILIFSLSDEGTDVDNRRRRWTRLPAAASSSRRRRRTAPVGNVCPSSTSRGDGQKDRR